MSIDYSNALSKKRADTLYHSLSAPGSDTEVIFNSRTNFGANPSFTFNGTTTSMGAPAPKGTLHIMSRTDSNLSVYLSADSGGSNANYIFRIRKSPNGDFSLMREDPVGGDYYNWQSKDNGDFVVSRGDLQVTGRNIFGGGSPPMITLSPSAGRAGGDGQAIMASNGQLSASGGGIIKTYGITHATSPGNVVVEAGKSGTSLGSIIFKTSGVNAITINTASNVGIHTPNPSASLHIVTGDEIIESKTGDSGVLHFKDKDGFSLQVYKDDAGLARIYNDEGSIGIAANSDTNDYFAFQTIGNVPALHRVGGNVAHYTTDSTNKIFRFYKDASNFLEEGWEGTSDYAYITSLKRLDINSNVGYILFNTNDMTITRNNVGINELNPAARLDVNGNLEVAGRCAIGAATLANVKHRVYYSSSVDQDDLGISCYAINNYAGDKSGYTVGCGLNARHNRANDNHDGDLVGFQAYVQNYADNATIANAIGVKVIGHIPGAKNSPIVTNFKGFDARYSNFSGTFSNVYGFYMNSGDFIGNHTANNRWGVFIKDTHANNFFAYRLGIGENITSPTVALDVDGDVLIRSLKELRFRDTSTNYIGFENPNTTNSHVYQLPINSGTNQQVMTVNAAGNLSWSNKGGGAGTTGAPINATYITLTPHASLTAERTLSNVANFYRIVDGGANANVNLVEDFPFRVGTGSNYWNWSSSGWQTYQGASKPITWEQNITDWDMSMLEVPENIGGYHKNFIGIHTGWEQPWEEELPLYMTWVVSDDLDTSNNIDFYLEYALTTAVAGGTVWWTYSWSKSYECDDCSLAAVSTATVPDAILAGVPWHHEQFLLFSINAGAALPGDVVQIKISRTPGLEDDYLAPVYVMALKPEKHEHAQGYLTPR